MIGKAGILDEEVFIGFDRSALHCFAGRLRRKGAWDYEWGKEGRNRYQNGGYQ